MKKYVFEHNEYSKCPFYDEVDGVHVCSHIWKNGIETPCNGFVDERPVDCKLDEYNDE